MQLLPKIETHASIAFRDIRCPAARADKTAEMIALGWRWLLRLHQRGKDIQGFRMVLVFFLARAVKAGRRLAGQEKGKDVLNERCQRRHGFRVERLPASTSTSHDYLYATPHGQRLNDAFEERLKDNMVTPILDQVQFRIDFASWLASLTPRERRIIESMSIGERTTDLATMYKVTPGRISQLRREFADDWHRFCGDADEQVAVPC
jgi:hypothetical protein